MKRILALVFAMLFTFAVAVNASAQTSDSMWLTADTTAYKTGESVIVDLNAFSATPIQGFTFQIRYDPACLEPVSASSPVAGMNGLPLPQLTGLVDGSYASTTPQIVSGKLAEIKFNALKGCQTGVTLESAALAVRSAEGFAASLPGVSIGASNVSLNIDRQAVSPQPAQVESGAESGAILPLNPPEAPQRNLLWTLGMVGIVFAVLAGSMMLGSFLLLRGKKASGRRVSPPIPVAAAARGKATYASPPATAAPPVKVFIPTTGLPQAALHIKHGPNAGKSISLTRLPIIIGRDPLSDICINDPYIIRHHAQIFSNGNGYYLKDLGGGTFINGHPVKSNGVVSLDSGDVVRLGKSVLFVFG